VVGHLWPAGPAADRQLGILVRVDGDEHLDGPVVLLPRLNRFATFRLRKDQGPQPIRQAHRGYITLARSKSKSLHSRRFACFRVVKFSVSGDHRAFCRVPGSSTPAASPVKGR
jgi:hypothetical protein